MAKRKITQTQQARIMRERRARVKALRGSQEAQLKKPLGLRPGQRAKVDKVVKDNLKGKQTREGARAFARKNQKRKRR